MNDTNSCWAFRVRKRLCWDNMLSPGTPAELASESSPSSSPLPPPLPQLLPLLPLPLLDASTPCMARKLAAAEQPGESQERHQCQCRHTHK